MLESLRRVTTWWGTAEPGKKRLAVLVLLLLAPFGVGFVTWLAFAIAKGIFAIGLAIVLGLAVVYGTPVLAMKFANWKLKAIKAEAAKNPIESLQNLAAQEARKLEAAQLDLAGWDADNQGMETGISDYKRDFPGATATTMEQTLAKSRECYGIAHARYLDSVESLRLFRVEIKRVDREWQLGLKAGRIRQRLFAFGKEEAVNEMIKDTALEAVRNQLATNMSALSLALQASGKPLTEPKALTEGRQGDVIDVVASPVTDGRDARQLEPVPVRRIKS